MKALISILLFNFGILFVNAAVLTVSNNANSPGQYTTMLSAIAAAASGDTMYVHGSPIDYGTISFDKPLTIIGAGGLPNKNYSFSTKITSLTLGTAGLGGTTATGSKIIGCEIANLTLNAGNNSTIPGISNIVITRNKISYIFLNQTGTNIALAHNNIEISNNIITVIRKAAGGTQNAEIRNCVIRNNAFFYIYGIGDEVVGSWVLTNNIILKDITGSRSGVVSNNIFYTTYSTSGFGTNNNYCSLSNNCFISTTHVYVLSDIIYGTNSGGNNLLNQDPLFVSFNPSGTAVWSYTQTIPPTAPFVNFNLPANSPCHLFGTDGTDIGIYGGISPFVEGYPSNSRYRYFPMPAIPQMLDMNITNTTIIPSGTLNLNFKARKQD